MIYSEFVESLRRLYNDKRIDTDRVDLFFNLKKITEQERLYILGKVGNEA